MLNIEYFLQKSGPASVGVRNEGGCKVRRPAETVCKRKETARKKFFSPAFFFYVGCFFIPAGSLGTKLRGAAPGP